MNRIKHLSAFPMISSCDFFQFRLCQFCTSRKLMKHDIILWSSFNIGKADGKLILFHIHMHFAKSNKSIIEVAPKKATCPMFSGNEFMY